MPSVVSARWNRADSQCPRALRAVEVLRQTADSTATLGAWSMRSGSLLMHKPCEGTRQPGLSPPGEAQITRAMAASSGQSEKLPKLVLMLTTEY